MFRYPSCLFNRRHCLSSRFESQSIRDERVDFKARGQGKIVPASVIPGRTDIDDICDTIKFNPPSGSLAEMLLLSE